MKRDSRMSVKKITEPIQPEFIPDYYVYTDGACSNNGGKHARAGIGIFFGIDDIGSLFFNGEFHDGDWIFYGSFWMCDDDGTYVFLLVDFHFFSNILNIFHFHFLLNILCIYHELPL